MSVESRMYVPFLHTYFVTAKAKDYLDWDMIDEILIWPFSINWINEDDRKWQIFGSGQIVS